MSWLALLASLGCTNPPPAATPGDTAPPTTGDDDDSPTMLGDDEGSVVLVAWEPSVSNPTPETTLAAMFVVWRRGWLNLAQCVSSPDAFCLDALPAKPGDSVLAQAYDPQILTQLDTREVGDEITLGPWVAPYVYDSNIGLGFYYDGLTGVPWPQQPIGLELGDGAWGPYQGTDDLVPPTPIELTSHDPLDEAEFYDTGPIHLSWTPGERGDVYLLATTPAESRLWWLDDDGEHDLDLSGLGLADGAAVDLVLGRWSRAEVNVGGNVAEVQVQSNQRLSGTWRKIGPRDELTDLYDTCADALSATPVPAGNYYGEFSGFQPDTNPGPNGCTGYAAPGPDAYVPIELQPDDLLEVSYRLDASDASLYLLDECGVVSSCLDGSDNTLFGGVESVTYFHSGAAPNTVYLVLDAWQTNVTDLFELDITITSLGGDILQPTCIEAQDQGPIAPGQYHGDIGGHADLLDPECAAGASGGEGLAQVYLLPGQTLTAVVTATGGVDPKMYLLSNCSIADSCFASADANTGAIETIVYQNPGPSSAFLYLAVDGVQNVNEYFLDIAIQ